MNTAKGGRLSPARGIGLVAIIGAGWFVGGPIGFVVAALALALALWRGPRFVAGLAFVALLATAVLTAVEAPTGPGARGIGFVVNRPVASEVGRIAGVLALASIGVAVARERAAGPGDECEPDG
jgi:hypothetical protein